ncbi:hypothetical protein [Aulosira sp. FACHB-615]|uniref:hypothetical protein n=1 Tax=Aulosira sp. FACHB-615 TaxID=2692777 RepID=UPI001F54BD5C|nr:hypothetical protein [Aulosira sp. FACHB-615]
MGFYKGRSRTLGEERSPTFCYCIVTTCHYRIKNVTTKFSKPCKIEVNRVITDLGFAATNNMAKRQTTKLNNQIIVRMDDETKEAFMNKVQSEGKTASELIMGWIRSYLAEERQEAPDLTTMHMELENLKQQVALIQNELLGKTAA